MPERRHGADQSAGRPPAAPGDEIVLELEHAIQDTVAWQQQLSRALICGLPMPANVVDPNAHLLARFGAWYAENQEAELVDQAVFRALAEQHKAMHAAAQAVVAAHRRDGSVADEVYDAFLAEVNEFIAQARRIAGAFRRAVSDLDPLTGVYNRQVMLNALERERERFRRTAATFSLALCDIDHFKKINDSYGHLVGDRVLRAVADRITANLRPYDSLFRYGGEEFLILLADTDKRTAQEVLERLRRAVAGRPMDAGQQAPLSVTLSFGFATMRDDLPIKDLTEQADQALYDAKQAGRNRVVAWGAPAEPEDEPNPGPDPAALRDAR